MSPVRSRWTAVPLALTFAVTLAVPALTALPAPALAAAPAEPGPSYRGHLSRTADGLRYLVVDAATGASVFTSPRGAVDGALGTVAAAGPTVVWVSVEPSAAGAVQRVHVVRSGVDTVVYSGAAAARVSDPALSADDRRVVFVLGVGATSSVLTVDIGTRAARMLRSSTTKTFASPTYSPDGRYLAWVQDESAGWAIVTALAASGADEVRLIHANHYMGTFEDAAWSPDGTRIAGTYRQFTHDTKVVRGVHVLSVMTGTNLPVAAPGSTYPEVRTDYTDPAWSSDGRLLVTRTRTTATERDVALVQVASDGSAAEEPVAAEGFAGNSSASRAVRANDTTAPGGLSVAGGDTSGASVHLQFEYNYQASTADTADVIVTRVAGAAADTPTAGIVVGQTRGQLDVALPAPDTEYGFSFFPRDWAGNVGRPLKVQIRSPQRTTTSLAALPAKVVHGAALRLAGSVTTTATSPRAEIWARRGGTASGVLIGTAQATADGAFAFSWTPQWSAEYQVRYAGTRFDYPSASPKRIVSVAPVVSLALSAARSGVGRTVTLAGGVRPSHAGQVVDVQRYLGNGSWRTIATTRLSSTSQYRYALKSGSRGTWALRVVKRADADHLLAVSPTRNLYVG